jgi:hypothetical protein
MDPQLLLHVSCNEQSQKPLTDDVAGLQGFSDRKVMHFNTMHGAFGGFVDPVAAERFQNRVKVCATIWCCVNQHPGDLQT